MILLFVLHANNMFKTRHLNEHTVGILTCLGVYHD